MTWLFLQVFLYCLASFLLGVLVTWFFAVRPRKKQIAGAQERIGDASAVAAGAGAADAVASGDAAADVDAAVDVDAAEAPVADAEAEVTPADADADAPAAEAALVTPDVDADAEAETAGAGAPGADADPGFDAPTGDAGPGESSAEAPLAGVSADGNAPSTEATGDAAAAGATGGVATATLVEPADAPGPEAPPQPKFGEGSAEPLEGGAAPSDEFRIKGNADSMLYHTTASPYYGRTIAEVWFRTEEDAQRAGFTAWNQRRRKK